MGFSGKEPLLGDKRPTGICRGRLPHFVTLVGIFFIVYICFWSYSARLNNIELEDKVKFYKGILRNMTNRMSRITARCNHDIQLLNQSADNLKICCSSKDEQERIAFECNSKLAESDSKCKNQITQQSEQMARMEQESNAKLQSCLKKLSSNNLQGQSREGQSERGQNLVGENSSKSPNIPQFEGHSREGQGVRGQNRPNIPPVEGHSREGQGVRGQNMPNIPPVEGQSREGQGVRGQNRPNIPPVEGHSREGQGVRGQNMPNIPPVEGQSREGQGVRGQNIPNITPVEGHSREGQDDLVTTVTTDSSTGVVKTTVFTPLNDGLAIKTTADQLKEAKSEKGVSNPSDGTKNKGIAPLGNMEDYGEDYAEDNDVKKGQSASKIQGDNTPSPTGVVSNETGQGQKDRNKSPGGQR